MSSGVIYLTPQGIMMLVVILGLWNIYFYKETPWYWLSETLYLGSFAAIAVVTAWASIQSVASISSITAHPDYIIGLILGVLCLFTFYRPLSYLARWPIAIASGVGLGLAMRTYIDVSLWVPLIATINLANPATVTGWINISTGNWVDNIVFILFFVSTIVYFVFTQRLGGSRLAKYVRFIGMYGIISILGMDWGAFVMSRISQGLIGVIFVLTGHYPPYI